MIGRLKVLAKNTLAIPLVRRVFEGGNRAILTVVGSHRLPATAYSLPAFLTFNREQFAVLAGRRAYYRRLSTSRNTHVELRRNIHRLEKGMSMQPRRPVFAVDYIAETVDFYRVAVTEGPKGRLIDPIELLWAREVLTEYFDVIAPGDPVVDRARDRFAAVPKPEGETNGIPMRPYPQRDIKPSDITFEQLLALAKQRRSVRWFEHRPVPRELLDQALQVARESPTACNRLPYEFLIFDDPELVKKVASIPFGTAGYSHQIPAIVVVKGNLDSYFSPRDRHAIYIDSSLATMGFLYALETLGLSSSVINWPDFEPLEMKMARALGLQPHERVICLIAVGYADRDALVASSPKKSLDVLRRFNVAK
ncbi:nitroreductase family protein [Pseudactinotalea sp. Z1739]|uniref:nitroreductase family protein n=1 Tax=Pseudactinotalea sp. Z1739 TaxID=3413028 RepID=UPI003C7BF9E6